jgi:P27 family predicted phage terminase small subunit
MTDSAPPHLSEEAQGHWRRITQLYDLDAASLPILEGGLEAFDRMREAQAILATEGIVITDRFGQRKQHPATLVERDAKATLLRNLKALGLDLEPLNARARPATAVTMPTNRRRKRVIRKPRGYVARQEVTEPLQYVDATVRRAKDVVFGESYRAQRPVPASEWESNELFV